MKSLTLTSLMLGTSLALAGCTTDEYGNRQVSRTVKGAGLGAAGGAGVAAITGGNVLAGAALGGAAGAVVGIVTRDRNRYEDRSGIRYYYDEQGREYRYDDRERKVYTR